MESIHESNSKESSIVIDQIRHQQRNDWLFSACGDVVIQPMRGDASNRRYFRIKTKKESFVLMDVPQEDNCLPFVMIANALRQIGVKTPEIIASDVKQRFLLLSDFGDTTYLKALNDARSNVHYVDARYRLALQELIKLQHCQVVTGWSIPPFQSELMWQEWRSHQEWFLVRLLGLSTIPETLDACFQLMVNSAVSQPQIFMHRDYHSANLMLLADETVGVLDFQDAFIGPITYDLVSLLRDCYITWPATIVNERAHHYWKMLCEQDFLHAKLQGATIEQFMQWFDWMGVERHLKALFTFARKKVRDQDDRYLQYIPSTVNYIIETTQKYSSLKPLYQYYQETVLKTLKEIR